MKNARVDWILHNQTNLKNARDAIKCIAEPSSCFLLTLISQTSNSTIRELSNAEQNHKISKTSVFEKMDAFEKYGFVVAAIKKEEITRPPKLINKRASYIDNSYGEKIYSLNIDRLKQFTTVMASVAREISNEVDIRTKEVIEIECGYPSTPLKLSIDCGELRLIAEKIQCLIGPMFEVLEKLSKGDYIDKQLKISDEDQSTVNRRLKKLEQHGFISRTPSENFVDNSLRVEYIDKIAACFSAVCELDFQQISIQSNQLPYKDYIKKIIKTVRSSQNAVGKDPQ